MAHLRLCYKVDESVGLAVDENGNNVAAYICVKAKSKSYEVSSEQYKDLEEAFKKLSASQMKIDEDKLTPVSINEYLDMTGDEDE